MNVHTVITDPQDAFELMELLKHLKKVREAIYTEPHDKFTIEVHTGDIKI